MTSDLNPVSLRRQQALQRLEASRLRLRVQLLDLPEPGEDGSRRHGLLQLPHRLQVLWRAMRRRLHSVPLASVALGAAHSWWQRHPLRGTGELLTHELNLLVTPAIRRHPRCALLLGAATGVALMVAKPWRWPLFANQLRPLPRQLGSWLFAQLSQAPMQALISALLVVLAGKTAVDAAQQDANPPPATE